MMSGELPATTEYVEASSPVPTSLGTESAAILPSESTPDTYTLASGSRYVQTEEQEQETRSVEEYLRRLAEKEKRQRRKRQELTPLQPAGGTSLVRKFSASLARVPSLRGRHTPHRTGSTAGSYEMTQSHYVHDAALPNRPVSDESEESQFMSAPPAADTRHELQDMTPLQPVAYVRAMDLSSTSLDDLSMLSDARKHDDTPAESPISPMDAPSGPFAESMGSRALARLRSRDFPSVTVGRASSLQRRQQAARGPPASLARSASRYGQTFEAIPESESADVALAAVPIPIDEADKGALEPMSQDTLSDLSSGYPPGPMMARTEAPDEPASDQDRWYWSDLLLTCGLCLSTNDDEEQAARTNPME